MWKTEGVEASSTHSFASGDATSPPQEAEMVQPLHRNFTAWDGPDAQPTWSKELGPMIRGSFGRMRHAEVCFSKASSTAKQKLQMPLVSWRMQPTDARGQVGAVEGDRKCMKLIVGNH